MGRVHGRGDQENASDYRNKAGFIVSAPVDTFSVVAYILPYLLYFR